MKQLKKIQELNRNISFKENNLKRETKSEEIKMLT